MWGGWLLTFKAESPSSGQGKKESQKGKDPLSFSRTADRQYFFTQTTMASAVLHIHMPSLASAHARHIFFDLLDSIDLIV